MIVGGWLGMQLTQLYDIALRGTDRDRTPVKCPSVKKMKRDAIY